MHRATPTMPPPELPDDLLGEAFLRLPPDDPACLLRASLACKRWRRILADPAFCRRHRELHRTPSVLGFLCTAEGDAPFASRFVPDNPTSVRPAARHLPGREVLDCRHGRVLFLTPSPSLSTEPRYDLVVWDPLTNEHRYLARPSPPLMDVPELDERAAFPGPFRNPSLNVCYYNAAVLCSAAVEGCDHSMCHRGPFRVAFVWSNSLVMYARVYSSEKDHWSEPISVQYPRRMAFILMLPSTLVGDTLYFHYSNDYALEYQLGAQRLSIIQGPPRPMSHVKCFKVIPMEDGGLGCMNVEDDESSVRLQLWSREAASGSDEVARWTRGRAIDLEELLPYGALLSPRLRFERGTSRRVSVSLLGFAEGTDVIFVGTKAQNHPWAVYMVQLNSGRSRKVFDQWTIVIPYTRFCIPVIDASSITEGPRDNASATVASSATKRPEDNASGA